MKTSIYISGQINGNFKLRNAIITAECEEKKGMFNAIELVFPTKKAAIKALSQGYKYFCNTIPEEKNNAGGFRYTRGQGLSYDASSAVISEQ